MKTVGLIGAILAAACLLSFSALVLAASASSMTVGDLVLVVSYPWGAKPSQIIVQSGLIETYPLRAPLGSLAVIKGPNDLNTLKENGAWLLLNGKMIATLC